MTSAGRAPGVSVVIATHNRPEGLRTALRAVLDQTYAGPIECLVVFDKSPVDESLTMDDGRRSVRVLPNERKPGLAGARNTGILHANFDHVAFCDDDDVWKPSKLQRQMASLDGGHFSVTGITISYKDKLRDRIPRADEVTLENLVRTRVMAAHPSSVLARRGSILEDFGLVDEDIPGSYGEDYDWIIRAARVGPVRVVEEPLVTVYWGGSMFSQKWQTIIEAIDYYLAKHEEFSQDHKALARERGRRAFAQAALGRRREAMKGALETVRISPTEKRSYLALAVACRMISAERVMDLAHRAGRGI